MDSYDLYQSVNRLMKEFFEANACIECDAGQCGLDHRAGYNFKVSKGCYDGEGFIAVRGGNVRTLSYYGGFEYVDAESVKTYGEWTIYFETDVRVASAIDCAFDRQENASE